MKIGVRKPSISKSIKARTTGKIKRALKSSVNPLYGKKGMGLVNDPKKAVYNKVYSKTTISAFDVVKDSGEYITSGKKANKTNSTLEKTSSEQLRTNVKMGRILAIFFLIICIFGFLANITIVGIIGLIMTFIFTFLSIASKKEIKRRSTIETEN